MMPSHAPCRRPARPIAHRSAHACRGAPSLPPSSRLTTLTRHAFPCVTGCSLLFDDSMSHLELAEEDTADPSNIKSALFFVVFWPFPHLSYLGEPGATRISASQAIQTAAFVSPVPPAPAASSRSDPGHFQDFTLTTPHHPTYSYLLLPACRIARTARDAMQMRSASASGVGATAVRAGERSAAVRARGSRWSAALSAMLAQWRVWAACASSQEHRYALN